MSDKNSSEEDAFFTPFQKLRRELDKKTPTAPAGKQPAGRGAGGEAKTRSPARSSSCPTARPPAGREEDDAALFLRAVNNPNFRPLEKAASRRPREETAESGLWLAAAGGGPGGAAEKKAARPAETAGTRTKPPSAAKPGPPPARSGPDETAATDPETDLFASAMRGVRPVDGRGRDLPPPKPETKINLLGDPDYLRDFIQGKVEFTLEHTDEFFEGHVTGLDPLVLAKLRGGQYSPEAHIDLHGQNAEQALESLVTFIRHAYNKGQRSLVVVTGRGRNSPGGLSVLRRNMQDWLTRDPLKRAVLAFCTAQPKDGGAGAIYVLLRKYKKSGKIRWDRA